MRLAFIGFALCAAIAGLSTYPWLTCAALMIGGANWVIALSLFNVTVQLSTPRWVVGRALSLYQTAMFGGMALGSWRWGVAAEDYGPDKALLASAALMIAGAALGLNWFGLPDQAPLNLDPLNRWKEPQLALDLKPRSGPIVIMIEYIIREQDRPNSCASWRIAGGSAGATERGNGRWRATWKTRKAGWRATTRRPGSNMSGTTIA